MTIFLNSGKWLIQDQKQKEKLLTIIYQDILDYMGSEELGANLFRITQTEAKLKKDSVENEKDACLTHYNVGKTIRKAIKELGGNMPETLPNPKKSIKELEKKELKKYRIN